MLPDRAGFRQRLDFKHIERGAGQLSFVQSRDNVCFDLTGASACVDQISASGKFTQIFRVQNSPRPVGAG